MPASRPHWVTAPKPGILQGMDGNGSLGRETLETGLVRANDALTEMRLANGLATKWKAKFKACAAGSRKTECQAAYRSATKRFDAAHAIYTEANKLIVEIRRRAR